MTKHCVQRFTVGKGGFIAEASLHRLLGFDADYPKLVRKTDPSYPVLELTDVHVHPLRRRKGWGGIVVQRACEWADDYRVDLFLRALPYNGSPFSVEELMKWYNRYNFRKMPRRPDWMMRYCNWPRNYVE